MTIDSCNVGGVHLTCELAIAISLPIPPHIACMYSTILYTSLVVKCLLTNEQILP